MALYKDYTFQLDTKMANSIDLQGMVNGDTGNVFYIQITADGVPQNITASRIRFIISNKMGSGSQDSVLNDSGIYFDEPQNGKFYVNVAKGMIADGINHGRVEIYTSNISQWDTLVTTQVFNFEAVTTYIVEKSAEYPSLISIEQAAIEALESLTGIDTLYVDEDTGHLIIVLTNGEEVDVGDIGSPEDSVRYVSQTKTDEQKATARTNIGAASSSHSHGNITSDGKISGSASQLVETNASGVIVATRKIVVGTADPSTVTGLNDGDIYLKYEE